MSTQHPLWTLNDELTYIKSLATRYTGLKLVTILRTYTKSIPKRKWGLAGTKGIAKITDAAHLELTKATHHNL